MTAVSLQCKIKNHHPEWSNVRAWAAGEQPISQPSRPGISCYLLEYVN
jgi:hypothetical protein